MIAQPNPSALTAADADLLEAFVAERRPDAFESLYRRHFDSVARAIERRCGDPTLADEAAQDAFLRLWNGAGGLRGVSRLRPWLITVAYHAALDRLRRKRLPSTPLEDAYRLASEEVDPAEAIVERERTAEMKAALANLPRAQRRALELSYYAGLSQSEVAKVLGEPLGTVKSRCRLGLMRLRELLDPASAAGTRFGRGAFEGA